MGQCDVEITYGPYVKTLHHDRFTNRVPFTIREGCASVKNTQGARNEKLAKDNGPLLIRKISFKAIFQTKCIGTEHSNA
jgi:hypothetical protein